MITIFEEYSDMFIHNEYYDKYVQLCSFEEQNETGVQKHHIIPKNYFKQRNIEINNSKDNLVILSYINHILAHYYLCKCVKE